MIAQIGPLVQAGALVRNPRMLHIAGGVLGGATSGVVLATVGLLIGSVLPVAPNAVVPVLGAALLALSLIDLKLVRVHVPRPSRQTPGSWSCRLGPSGAVFAWGFDLGTSVTTALPYVTLLILPASALLGAGLGPSIVTLSMFGAARAAAVGLAISSDADTADVCTRLAAARWPSQLVGITGAIVGIAFLTSSIPF